jgi:serine/threonine protein phosphatase PrpC
LVIDVLAADSDPEGDTLTVTTVGSTMSGTVTINADGTITYAPSGFGMGGVSTFTYTISDGHGGTSTGTISVTVATGPIAVNAQAKAYTALPATIDVLAGDTDGYGDSLTVTSVGGPSHGTAYLNADGTIAYIRTAGTTASSDSFTYTITDGHGGTSTATVTIFLEDLPVANDDTGATTAGVATIKVLANDYDPDGEQLTVVAVGSCAYGTAVINADGTITYTGTPGQDDHFTYTVSDGHGGTSIATVWLV